MKKIAIDLTSLDDNFSGIERYSFEIVKNLIELDQKNQYILIFKNKPYKYFVDNKKNNVEFYICSGGKLMVNQFKIRKAIKNIRPNIVYFPAFPPSLLLRKNKNIKYISMIHDIVAWDCPNTMKFKSRLLFKFGIKHALKISSFITVNSNFTKERVEERLKYRKKIYVIPCSAEIGDNYLSFDEVKGKYLLPDKYLLSLGTLEPRKNFDGLLKMYDEYCQSNENTLPLVIVGRKGWKIEQLFEQLDKIKDKVFFTGFVEDEYLSSIYYYASAFIFASKYEGFGIPVLEALRANCLPIVSRIPSNLELLGSDYPFIFDEGSFINICQKFNDTLDEDKKKLLKNKIMDLKHITWENSARGILEIINNQINNNSTIEKDK